MSKNTMPTTTTTKKIVDANLSVGFVAKRSGVNVSALHFYESKGLIRSWRNNGNQRRYKPDVLRRVAVIKAAQTMGITLDDIKSTLDTLPEQRTPTKKDWSALSKKWQAQLDERIAYMQRLRDKVDGCIGCGCLSMNNCPIYNKDDHLGDEQSGAVLLNTPQK
ncbi:redox-sensitive transcriptional activator SoxR [Pseudoalteromonas neustonica]|uniref:Redox-sensitive transcriptional activator SoxR n=2 Tax=Pseudoalteromonas TaxID=53246 RepID=A0ABU9TX72_9GAMM|nr:MULTISPECIES: redox-sensitive transcriptional activator SoxR [Pseudoalteromonas]